MPFVYIVVENSDMEPEGGGVYPTTYKTFEDAKAAVIEKYKDELNRQIEEVGNNSEIMKYVDVPESTTGFTTLYIEKEINFYIHKLHVSMSGGKRSLKSNTRKRNMKK
jgi:hypothetical protein